MTDQEKAAAHTKEVAERLAQAAKRANAEAQERRDKEVARQMPRELGGPKGPEPTRYGDWQVNGIVSDF